MIGLSLEDRLGVISSLFCQAYFGHVILEKAIWAQLESYCDSYVAACENAALRSSRANPQESVITDGSDAAENLLEAVSEVINEHKLNHFPVCRQHQQKVIEWLENLLSNYPLQSNVKKLLNAPDGGKEESSFDESEYIYKTFDRGGGDYVTLLEENRDIIGHGTTGLTSWQGALYLADWIGSNKSVVEGRHVLELGSGVGMLGIALLKTVAMESYTFTDCNDSVLDFLAHNLKQNFVQHDEDCHVQLQKCMREGPENIFNDTVDYFTHNVSSPQDKSRGNVPTSIVRLDWLDDELRKKRPEVNPGVLLGSDIVYERSLIAPLCKVLGHYLSKSGCLAYIACTERSATTLQCFEDALNKEGFVFIVVARGTYSPQENVLCSDVQHQPTRIYQIQK